MSTLPNTTQLPDYKSERDRIYAELRVAGANKYDMKLPENSYLVTIIRSDEHIMALVSDDTVKFIQRSPGHSIPNMPILQSGYFPVIVRDGTGRVYDNRKQAYQISLID